MAPFIALGLLSLLFFNRPAAAFTIGELLDAAAKQPAMEVSDLAQQEGQLRVQAATAALLPKINLFGKAELYNSPTNLRPMPPTEINIAAGDDIPFSREILRYGLTLEAPLYAQRLYHLQTKMERLAEGATVSRQIRLSGRLAAVVSLNSLLQVQTGLAEAIQARLASLGQSRDDMALKVANGRAAEADQLKIDAALNDLAQQRNTLAAQMIEVQSGLEKLTGFSLAAPVAMVLTGEIHPGTPIEVAKGEKDVAALDAEVRARRAARYPTLGLYGMLSGNDGQAYNTDDHVFREYHIIGLALSLPLFDRGLSCEEQIARIQLRREEKQLQDTRAQLAALDKSLQGKLPLVERSIELARQALSHNEQLLAIAQVAHANGRMTTEEYLRTESQLLAAKAQWYKAQDERWQLISQQAVLYGTELREVVK